MKRWSLIAMLFVLAAGAAVPTGARANQGIYGIWWDAKDTSDDGLGFGFRSKVQVAPLFAFDTRVSWIRFSDDHMNVIPIEATGMLKLGMVYAGAGVGYYVFDVSNNHEEPLAPVVPGTPESRAQLNDVDNNFGWYAVAGIDIAAGPVGIFGEVKWMQLSADARTETGPITLDANGLGFNLGAMFGASKP